MCVLRRPSCLFQTTSDFLQLSITSNKMVQGGACRFNYTSLEAISIPAHDVSGYAVLYVVRNKIFHNVDFVVCFRRLIVMRQEIVLRIGFFVSFGIMTTAEATCSSYTVATNCNLNDVFGYVQRMTTYCNNLVLTRTSLQ